MKFKAISTRLLLLCLLAALSAVNGTAVNFEGDSDEKQASANNDAAENGEVRGDGLSRITDEVLEKVFRECQKTLKHRHALEVRLAKKGRVVKSTDRIADISLIRNRNSDPTVREREECHLLIEEASKELYDRYNLTDDEVERLHTVKLNSGLSRSSRDKCTEKVKPAQCDRNARFRTADGQCNNLNNPTYGSAYSCQQRLLPAHYIGISDFRESIWGELLPPPRTLSLKLHYHLNRPTKHVTHMYMFFGQLLDHDLALTPFGTTIGNSPIQCCPPARETHCQCRPILISPKDPFYSQYGITCLNFVRSVVCPTCALGPRQQMNIVTSFIDASFVYGNSDNETTNLRTDDDTGRMLTQKSNYGDLLPPRPSPKNDRCSFHETDEICFLAGDPRSNQHTLLTSLHTIFVREHNRLVAGLKRINPQWYDERLFQEARRILGAQMQVITYKEYLPITLGRDRMSYFDLWIGDNTRYNSRENPSLIIEFSTAAFRFGHSMINSVMANYPLNATNEPRLLRNEFFQPFDVYRGFMEPLVMGASDSPAQSFDQHMVEDVTNFLFRVRGSKAGLDLASLNINRGRDNGIPPYVEMVRYCSYGEMNIRRFSDLVSYKLMGHRQTEDLRRNYRDVYDVDLWPGILMETPLENAVVGPTGACIIGTQFYKLKYGDRFYFEHRNSRGRFTLRQMEELRKTSLSQIICLNTGVPHIAKNAMLFNNRDNPKIACCDVRSIDLSWWKE